MVSCGGWKGLPQGGGWTGGGEQVATVGAALAVPAGTGLLILLQCAFPARPVSYALLLEPFLALSSVSLSYLPGVGSWGCHLGADVLHLLCGAQVIQHTEPNLCYSSYNINSPGGDRAIVCKGSSISLGLALSTCLGLIYLDLVITQ